VGEIEFAPLVESDLALLEEWFKDGETAARMPGMLPLPEWFAHARRLAGQANWLAYEDGSPVGFASLESYADGSASFSLLARPDMRRKGYGRGILDAIVAHSRKTGISWLNGYVENTNAASIKLMEKGGFAHTAGPDEDGFLTYSLELTQTQSA
jgi:L-amino acid N-acyltransferase YncA